MASNQNISTRDRSHSPVIVTIRATIQRRSPVFGNNFMALSKTESVVFPMQRSRIGNIASKMRGFLFGNVYVRGELLRGITA